MGISTLFSQGWNFKANRSKIRILEKIPTKQLRATYWVKMFLMLTPELSRWCKKRMWSLIEHSDTQPHWSLTKAFPLQGYVSITEYTPPQLRAMLPLPSLPRGGVALPKPAHRCGSGQRGRINPVRLSQTLVFWGSLRNTPSCLCIQTMIQFICAEEPSRRAHTLLIIYMGYILCGAGVFP